MDTIVAKHKGFEIHLTNNDMTNLCCICDPKFLAHNYEFLNYSFDTDDNIYGFYVTRNDGRDIIYATCVLDLNCSTICERFNRDVNTVEYAEITLLCSNKKHRIPGLTRSLLEFVKNWVKKRGVKYLVLSVANIKDNPVAVKFYEQQEFIPLGKDSEYIYTLK